MAKPSSFSRNLASAFLAGRWDLKGLVMAGVVVNHHPNVQRAEYDRLKAILHNCLRWGPTSQNRERYADFRAFLAGRIAYVAMLNPEKGRRLREAFEQIRW